MVGSVPRPLCIYHKNCLDGKAAAAVVLRHWPDAELLPMQYGEAAPTVEGRAVAVVDFSLPLEAMRALRAQAASLTWIDHHASSVELVRRLGWGHIDTDTCGAVLTWRTLFPNLPAPAILAYIEDKDLWRWRLPDSRAVAAGLALRFGGTDLNGLLEADPAAMAELGRPLLAKQAARVAKALTGGTPLDNAFGMPGLRALVVPARADLNEIGEEACAQGYDLAVMLYRKADGTWVHSLRSSRIDCAALAARHGGGGHPASACYLSRTPLVPPAP
jgi:oligoribonuclease NrnB/cAMP/cGMP phosphodiesterase (DHH superfamily)